jgi:hypothetical protein
MMYGAAWMQSAVASRVAEDDKDDDPRRELNAYLNSPLEPFHSLTDTDILQWWKNHAIVYPTLVRMARDYLAICGSSTASERQFSSARHIGTNFRNRLTPTMFKAVQLLKGGYKAGVISAHLEVAALAKELDCPIEELVLDSVELPSEK